MGKYYELKGNVHKLYLGDYGVYTIDLSNPSNSGMTYLHKDRLGSVVALSDESGQLIDDTGRGYDPFGRPREGDWSDSDGSDDATGMEGDLNGFTETSRGFTGHEHLNGTNLVHMNGRVFDYNLGRFVSVDPFIQSPDNSQSINPYSYLMNNPLSGTDPTGYIGCTGTLIESVCNKRGGSLLFNGGTSNRPEFENQPARNNGTGNTSGESTATSTNPSTTGSLNHRTNMDEKMISAESQTTSSTGPTLNPLTFLTEGIEGSLPSCLGTICVPAVQKLAGTVADGITALEQGVDDFTFDQGAGTFVVGRVFNELALAPGRHLAESVESGSSSGVLLAGAGLFVRGGSAISKGIDDVITSASRPARLGSQDSRALQALKKKIDRGDDAFSGLPKTQDAANDIIRRILRAENPIIRTKTRNGQTVRDVFDSVTGRGVRTIDGEFDTFVNLK